MTIVVGYVPRREGLAALDAALAEAERGRERLVVVNAAVPGDRRGLADPRDVASLCRRLAEIGVPHELLQPCRGGSAAEELLTAAAEHSARLVVVGLRGSHPLGSLPGSTVRHVLTEAGCDVLAVRPAVS
jgi:nucleotide-binding universal stress UspA family protein